MFDSITHLKDLTASVVQKGCDIILNCNLLEFLVFLEYIQSSVGHISRSLEISVVCYTRDICCRVVLSDSCQFILSICINSIRLMVLYLDETPQINKLILYYCCFHRIATNLKVKIVYSGSFFVIKNCRDCLRIFLKLFYIRVECQKIM